jgi:hypothetical protein
MTPRDGSGGVHIAAIPDLGRIRVALQQEWLAARASSAQTARQDKRKYSRKPHALKAIPLRRNRKCDAARDRRPRRRYSKAASISDSIS